MALYRRTRPTVNRRAGTGRCERIEKSEMASVKKYYLKRSAYRYIVLLWIFLVALLSLFLISFAILITKETGDTTFWFIACVMIVLTLSNIPLTILNIYLVISEEGVKFKMYVRTIIAKWHDAEGLVKASASGIFKNQEGVMFTTAELVRKPRNLLFPPMRLPQTFVPLSWFSDNWQNSEILDQIKRYAPHLIEEKQRPLELERTP